MKYTYTPTLEHSDRKVNRIKCNDIHQITNNVTGNNAKQHGMQLLCLYYKRSVSIYCFNNFNVLKILWISNGYQFEINESCKNFSKIM